MKKIGFLSIVIIMSLAVIMPLGHRAYGQERVTIGLGSIRMNIHEYFRPDGNVDRKSVV